jgi:hypothetical protein
MSSQPRRRTADPLWSVRVHEHQLANGRWRIPQDQVSLMAPSAKYARLRAIRWAHADQGAPPAKRCVLESWPYTTATPATREEYE